MGAKLDGLAAKGDSILVWGLGALCQHLLASGRMDRLRIAGFVDSNPRLQGRTHRGVPILCPAEVKGRSETILITSLGCRIAIEGLLRDAGITNLYCALD
jgi:hypothetical protein